MEQGSLFEKDEAILETVRKHFIVYLEDFFIHSFGCILFIGGAYGISQVIRIPMLSQTIASHIALILVAFVILFWTSFFYAWTKNYLDIWYVTTKHIVAINQKDLFQREDAFMELTRIQDVFFEKEGFLSTLLGYGTLKVQSAGTEQEFTINDVRNVEQVAHRIMELRDEVHKQQHAASGL